MPKNIYLNTTEELIKHVEQNIGEKAAIPKHFDIVDEMPKTPIGKIFKPELRKRAIKRVYNEPNKINKK